MINTIKKVIAVLLVFTVIVLVACSVDLSPVKAAEIGNSVNLDGYGECDYLHSTIQSAFATYGGNYNGITYTEFLKSDTRTAAIAFERVYERCGDYAFEDSRRADNAEAAYNKFHK